MLLLEDVVVLRLYYVQVVLTIHADLGYYLEMPCQIKGY